jgi:hypothetical protein
MPRKSLAAIEFPNRSERKSHDLSKPVGLSPGDLHQDQSAPSPPPQGTATAVSPRLYRHGSNCLTPSIEVHPPNPQQ